MQHDIRISLDALRVTAQIPFKGLAESAAAAGHAVPPQDGDGALHVWPKRGHNLLVSVTCCVLFSM